MMLRFTLGFSLLAAFAGSQAFAQPAKPLAPVAKDDTFEKDLDKLFAIGGLTADQAARRAPRASPLVVRRSFEIEAAIAQTVTTELARVPRITANLVYSRLSSIPQINLGGFTIPVFLDSYLAEGSISVPLSDYVLRFPKLTDAARLNEQAVRVSKRTSEVDASQDARLSYYEWVRSRLQVLVAERQLAQVQSTVVQFRALAEAQRLSKADLLRVESQEAEAEQTLDQLQNLARLREEQLRVLIDAAPDEQLAIGEDIRAEVVAPGAAKLDDLVGTAKAQRLEFRQIDLGIAAKDKQRAAEKANLLPQLSAFGVADYANPNQRIFPLEGTFKFTWQAGVRLTWTLNDTLVSRQTDRRLGAEAAELVADRENLIRGTRIELLSAQQQVEIAQHALATSQKGLAAATEAYRVRRELLAADRATALELVDVETDLTRARITALNARVDLRVAISELAHALGNDVK
jgi:outer membrane protein TolC